MFFQSPLPDYTPESPGWVFSHLAPTECWLPFPRRSWPLSSFLVSRCTYAGSLSLRLAPTLHRGLKRLLSLSSALAASCLMTLYMANSFHLARTTKLRLALRGRGRSEDPNKRSVETCHDRAGARPYRVQVRITSR